jgi:hypothetical protein
MLKREDDQYREQPRPAPAASAAVLERPETVDPPDTPQPTRCLLDTADAADD